MVHHRVLVLALIVIILIIYNPPSAGGAQTQNYGILKVSSFRDQTTIGMLGRWGVVDPTIATVFRARVNSGQPDPVVALILAQILVVLGCIILGKAFEACISGNFAASATNLSHGRVWTLLTSAINHNGGFHLFFNLLVFSQVCSHAMNTQCSIHYALPSSSCFVSFPSPYHTQSCLALRSKRVLRLCIYSLSLVVFWYRCNTYAYADGHAYISQIASTA